MTSLHDKGPNNRTCGCICSVGACISQNLMKTEALLLWTIFYMSVVSLSGENHGEKYFQSLFLPLIQTVNRVFRPLRGLGSRWPLPLLPSATRGSQAHQVHVCAALTNQGFYQPTHKKGLLKTRKRDLQHVLCDLPEKTCQSNHVYE